MYYTSALKDERIFKIVLRLYQRSNIKTNILSSHHPFAYLSYQLIFLIIWCAIAYGVVKPINPCIMYIAWWISPRLDGGLCVAEHESAHHSIQWKSETSCVMERRYRLEPGLWPGDRLSYGLAASIRTDTRAQPSLGSFRSFSIRRKFSRPGSCEIHGRTSSNRWTHRIRPKQDW